MQITTIGIDLAKTVFCEPCLIGIEACATSHYWARELAKFGHTVKLMPPAYVKPYVKRGKNDAEAISD